MSTPNIYPFLRNENGIYRPVVPVLIINPLAGTARPYQAIGLLDTGADSCVFPSVIPNKTGHNLKANGVESCMTHGVSNEGIECWKHTFIIQLMPPLDKFQQMRGMPVWQSKRTLVNCVENENLPVILGWDNFLSNFKITFNYLTKKIIIEIP